MREEPGPPVDPARELVRKLYLPYAWGVFGPITLVQTLFWGVSAVLSSKLISPNVGFHCGTAWSWLLCRANFSPVKLVGRENADPRQSYVIMSNHQSHFDVLAFYSSWGRQFRWVIKEELRKTPGLGWGCEAVGHIFIDRSDRDKAIASLNAARPLLTGGTSVMFFPEGHRSPDGRLQEFKKGGFMMALDLGLPILPVSISGTHKILPGGKLQLQPGKVRISVHPPIDVTAYGREKRDELMADVREAIASGLSPYERGESEAEEQA